MLCHTCKLTRKSVIIVIKLVAYKKNEMFSGNKDSSVNGVNKSGGKKLSRLVRRRESKRDRSSSGVNPGSSPKSTEKNRIADKSEMSNKDNLENNPKSISLLPGGIMHSTSTSFIQANNTHESSDNDS